MWLLQANVWATPLWMLPVQKGRCIVTEQSERRCETCKWWGKSPEEDWNELRKSCMAPRPACVLWNGCVDMLLYQGTDCPCWQPKEASDE